LGNIEIGKLTRQTVRLFLGRKADEKRSMAKSVQRYRPGAVAVKAVRKSQDLNGRCLCESDETFNSMVAEKLSDRTMAQAIIFLDKINKKTCPGLTLFT
jgi:hypothetical protein